MFMKIFMNLKICLSLVIIHSSEFFDLVNKKVIGKMKDELIHQFVGLKSKMYSIVSVDCKENKKAKGVNKNVVKDKT